MSILESEVISDASFVSNHVHLAFGNLCSTHVGRLLKQIALDKAEQEHFPHFQKLRRDAYEAIICHVGLNLSSSLCFELSWALLCAYGNNVVLVYVG